MIRTAQNLNLQSVKHEKHSENPNWDRTCIDSNISPNFEPKKQQKKYKRSVFRWNDQMKLCWRQNQLNCTKLEHSQHEHKKLTASNLTQQQIKQNHSTLKPLLSSNQEETAQIRPTWNWIYLPILRDILKIIRYLNLFYIFWDMFVDFPSFKRYLHYW